MIMYSIMLRFGGSWGCPETTIKLKIKIVNK